MRAFGIGLILLLLFNVILVKSVTGEEQESNRISIEKLWQKPVTFSFDLFKTNPDLTRLIFKKFIGPRDRRYIIWNGDGEQVYTIEPPSEYGTVDDKRHNISEHPDYLLAKKNNKLSQLDFVVDETIVPSDNLKFLGVVQIYYNKAADSFNKRFKFYQLDQRGTRTPKWELDPCCEDTKLYDCLENLAVSDIGQVMLWFREEGNPIFGKRTPKLIVYDETGKQIYQKICELCSQCIVEKNFYSTDSFHLAYIPCQNWYDTEREAVRLFFNGRGEDITSKLEAERYERYFDQLDKPFLQPSELPIDFRSGLDRVIDYDGFRVEGVSYIVAIRYSYPNESRLYLHKESMKNIVWVVENTESAYQFRGLGVSRDGDIITVGLKYIDSNSLRTFPSEHWIFDRNGVKLLVLKELGWIVYSKTDNTFIVYNDTTVKKFRIKDR